MTEFVPSGYISIREALNRLGRELFGSEWTGEEHTARTGLVSADKWLKMKNLPGTGASGGGMRRGGGINWKTLPGTGRGASPSRPRGGNNQPNDSFVPLPA